MGKRWKVDCDGLVYCSPSCDVDGGVDVRTTRATTGTTGEQALRLPAGSGAITADMAGTGSSPGIDEDHRHTRKLCLVAYERVQLEESPVAKALPRRPWKPYPGADAREVLQGNPSHRAFGFRDQLFGNAVVGVLLKPFLPAAQLLEVTLCGFGALLLERLAQRCRSLPDRIDPGAGEGDPVARGSDGDDALVHTEVAFGLQGRSVGQLYDHAEKELFSLADQIGLAPERFHLKATVAQGDLLTSVNGGDARGRKIRKGKEPGIVHHGRIGLERMLDLSVNFVRCCHLLEGPHHELGTQGRGMPRGPSGRERSAA